ncbi:MAG: hypothetical protein CSA62_02285 [Planctomycetota bacterium]|nr:MAG: hypothetical protein CSA62_02285 [Planctomycetota bacterium]
MFPFRIFALGLLLALSAVAMPQGRTGTITGQLSGVVPEGCELRLEAIGAPGQENPTRRKLQCDAKHSFRVEGLAPGSYRLVAWKNGSEISAFEKCFLLPGAEQHVDLTCHGLDQLRVRVVDQSAAPIAGARILASVQLTQLSRNHQTWMRGLPQQWEAKSDSKGEAILTVPGAIPYSITASHQDGRGAHRLLSADHSWGPPIQLQLRPMGRIVGKVADAKWLAYDGAWLRVIPLDRPQQSPSSQLSRHGASWHRVGVDGRIDSRELAQGRYRLELVQPPQIDAKRPLLHGDVPTGFHAEHPDLDFFEHHPCETRELTVSTKLLVLSQPLKPAWTPKAVEIQGRVLRAGKPVPGASVFASTSQVTTELSFWSYFPALPASPRSDQSDPNSIVTDAEGRFRFRGIRTGTWYFRAWMPGTHAQGPEQKLAIRASSSPLPLTLDLGTSTVRARVLPGRGNDWWKDKSLQLFRGNEAAMRPNLFGSNGLCLSSRAQEIPIDGQGRIELKGLSPGPWLLRLVPHIGPCPFVRFDVGEQENLDLGTLSFIPRHQVELPLDAQTVELFSQSESPSFRIFRMDPLLGKVFVADLDFDGQRIPSLRLNPGKYKLQNTTRYAGGLAPFQRPAVPGLAIEFEVDEKGAVHPTPLSF